MSGLTRNQLTSESKALLRKTVRGLRESLIAQLKEAAEQRYLLSVPLPKVKLGAEAMALRQRLEAALDQAAAEEGGGKEARARAFELAARQAGATLLNRLVLIRHLEALGLSKPAVLTGGWMSKGYREFQSVAGALCEDETQGMQPLLELLFAELAVPLPGLFGEVGLTRLFPVAPATLREVIQALDEVPADAWSDDLTLGWVYQFWNDPDREALDAKLDDGGRVEPHEIASKTQMFTERYMVEWLLQNSLGATWLAMCRKNGWMADAESTGTLQRLDERRAEWRKKREAGEVALDALMPIDGVLEEAWKYYVPQPMPDAVVEHAPKSIRELKLLDPACGSGHFLVVAFDLLVELYREEARHTGQAWSDRQIAEWILEKNLHGIDIDPRAVQIAAAALYLKARALAKDVEPRQVSLVAPSLKLSALDEKDPGLVKLEKDIEHETGIPPELTRELIETLAGVDHLGSLLKVGDAIDKALEKHEGAFAKRSPQKELFPAPVSSEQRRAQLELKPLVREEARKIVLDRLEGFLGRHAGGEDLGLRLRGQQLSAGLRFASIAKEGEYHVVVGNPPYQGTSKMRDATYVSRHYPRSKSDLYAAFLERSVELCRRGGFSALVAMRNWMFIAAFAELRRHLFGSTTLRLVGDLNRGAFEEIDGQLVAVAMTIVCNNGMEEPGATAIRCADAGDTGSYPRLCARLLAQADRVDFLMNTVAKVPGVPLVYWWKPEFADWYASRTLLGSVSPARAAQSTGNNARFVRAVWEVADSPYPLATDRGWNEAKRKELQRTRWHPFINGASGARWIEPLRSVVNWQFGGLEIKLAKSRQTGRDAFVLASESYFYQAGVACEATGTSFSARLHRYRSVFDVKGQSLFPSDPRAVCCFLNGVRSRFVAESLNPTFSFQVGDINRLPVADAGFSGDVFDVLESEFARHEAARETSVEFRQPGPQRWAAAQQWAQDAVDRESMPQDALVADWVSSSEDAQLSYQVGVALGRFAPAGAVGPERPTAFSRGGVFVSGCREDGLGARSLAGLRELWESVRGVGGGSLREWLCSEFFAYHRKLYEGRPVYLPLCSSKRTFVAYVHIRAWTDSTLPSLLSEHLVPERKVLEGVLADLRAARSGGDKKTRAEMEKQVSQHQRWLEELEDFIAKVAEISEKGPPQSDPSTPARETNAPFAMTLDDGVMINAAGLWPLLEPVWKEPKKWWKELAMAKGRKDYDWSHLAARYFPNRVREKCKTDPSLAVAHGCLWLVHPETSYKWELWLQDEIGPDFRIDERDSDALRAKFLKEHPKRAAELEAAEQVRRQRKAAKQDQDELELDAAEQSEGDEEGEAA